MSPGASVDALAEELRRLGRVVVGFSGGADSAFLAKIAHDTLGREKVLVATALSPSLASEEEADCRALAEEWGLRWLGVRTDEMDDPAYVANGEDRCAHCKTALMNVLTPFADAESATVALGVNMDDLGDYRPGQSAAAGMGAVFPLVAAGFSKQDVREWSKRLGLRTWDKPAGACLASRIPYGMKVTLGALGSIEVAEAGLRALGFRQVRVRHHGVVARIEVEEAELARVVERREEVLATVLAAGYLYVALDLQGFSSGSMNKMITMNDMASVEGVQ